MLPDLLRTRLSAPFLAALILSCSSVGGSTVVSGPRASEPASAAQPLLLLRGQQLLLRTASGGEQQVLRTANGTYPGSPAWSRDRKTIAYTVATPFLGQESDDWGDDIYEVGPLAGAPRLLWRHRQPGEQIDGIAWEPGGNSLLFGYLHTIVPWCPPAAPYLNVSRIIPFRAERTYTAPRGSPA